MRKTIAFFLVLAFAASIKSELHAQIRASIPRVPVSVFPIGPFAATPWDYDPWYTYIGNTGQKDWGCFFALFHDEGWNMWHTINDDVGNYDGNVIQGEEWLRYAPDNMSFIFNKLAFVTQNYFMLDKPNGSIIRNFESFAGAVANDDLDVGCEWRYFLATNPKWSPNDPHIGNDFHFETYQLDNFTNGAITMWQPMDASHFSSLIQNNLNNSEFTITPTATNEEELRLVASPATLPQHSFGELWPVLSDPRAQEQTLHYALGAFESLVPADNTGGLVADFIFRFDPTIASLFGSSPLYEVQYQLLDQYGQPVLHPVDYAKVPVSSHDDIQIDNTTGIISQTISYDGDATHANYAHNIPPSGEHKNILTFPENSGTNYAVARLDQAVSLSPNSYTSNQVGTIQVTNLGSNYTSEPTVTMTDADGTNRGTQAQAYIDGITSVDLTSGGSHLISGPIVTITYDDNGTMLSTDMKISFAWGYCYVWDTHIDDPGSGYSMNGANKVRWTDPTKFQFSWNNCFDATGSPPAISLGIGTEEVTKIVVTSPGSGYTGTPSIAISGGGGTSASASATMGGIPSQLVATLVALPQQSPLPPKPPSIYVRGWRFRTVSADRTLRGLDDADLQKASDAILNSVSATSVYSDPCNGGPTVSGTPFDRILMLADWPESDPRHFRCQAYVDNYFYNYCKSHKGNGKHITSFGGGSFPWYRAIFEDQNGYAPDIDNESGLADEGPSAFWSLNQNGPTAQCILNGYTPGNNYSRQKTAVPIPSDLISASVLINPSGAVWTCPL